MGSVVELFPVGTCPHGADPMQWPIPCVPCQQYAESECPHGYDGETYSVDCPACSAEWGKSFVEPEARWERAHPCA